MRLYSLSAIVCVTVNRHQKVDCFKQKLRECLFYEFKAIVKLNAIASWTILFLLKL